MLECFERNISESYVRLRRIHAFRIQKQRTFITIIKGSGNLRI